MTGPQGPVMWFSTVPAEEAAAGFPLASGQPVGSFDNSTVVPGETLTATAWVANSVSQQDSSGNYINVQHEVHVIWTVQCNGADQTIDTGQTLLAPSSWYDDVNQIVDPTVSTTFTVDQSLCTSGFYVPGLPNFYVSVDVYVTDVPNDVGPGGGIDLSAYESAGLPSAQTAGCDCGDSSGVNRPTVSRGDPVDTATGAYDEAVNDVTVPGIGVPFSLQRAYASDNTASGPLGPGWTLPWSAALTVDSSGNVTYSDASGARYPFAKNSDGSYSGDGANHSVLVAASGGGFTLTAPDHKVWSFNSSGQLTGLRDGSGHGLTFAYTAGQVSSITDAEGRAVALTYTSGLLSKVALADGRSVSYQYTGGRLTTATGVDGAKTVYGYDSGGRLASITDWLNHVVTQNTYDTSGRVVSQTDASGQVTKFAYKTSGVTSETDTTVPGGGIWTDLYLDNVLSATIDPLGKQTDTYHDGDFNTAGQTDPLGDNVTASYDGSDRLTSSTYGPSYTYDASGNVTQASLGLETTNTTYDAPRVSPRRSPMARATRRRSLTTAADRSRASRTLIRGRRRTPTTRAGTSRRSPIPTLARPRIRTTAPGAC